jgi:hypothetical protein
VYDFAHMASMVYVAGLKKLSPRKKKKNRKKKVKPQSIKQKVVEDNKGGGHGQ